MHKFIRVVSLVIIFLWFSPVFSQSLDGIKEIVTIQQEKIARIENDLKNLIGSFESLSNQKQNNKITTRGITLINLCITHSLIAKINVIIFNIDLS